MSKHSMSSRRWSSCSISDAEKSSDGTEGRTHSHSRMWGVSRISIFHFTSKTDLKLLGPAIIASMVAGLIPPICSFLVGRILDSFITFNGAGSSVDLIFSQVRPYILAFVGAAFASWISHAADMGLWMAFGELQARSARLKVFKALLGRDLAWYDRQAIDVSTLLSQITASVRDLQLATSQPLAAITTQTATVLACLVLAFASAWELTLVILAICPLILVSMVWLGARMQRHILLQNDNSAAAHAISSSAIRAIETVKCFNGERSEVEKYSTSIRQAARSYYCVANLLGLQMATAMFLSTVMCVAAFYFGAVLIHQHERTTGAVITTFLSAIGAVQGLQTILPQLPLLDQGQRAGMLLKDLSQAEPTDRHIHSHKPPQDYKPTMKLRNVTFAYPANPEQPVINDISISIASGRTTFILGQSGSGKSTIGQLIAGLYYPTDGFITLDEYPLNLLPGTWLRNNITLVEQTSSLFDDSVHENILLGKSNDKEFVSQDDVFQAVEFALLRSMIADLPQGLKTMIGPTGSTLSGGQRQRMALARARLRDPPILILDESTSALDLTTRALLHEAIRYWRSGKTTIIITHDVTQILPEDDIFILNAGHIIPSPSRPLEALSDRPLHGPVLPHSTEQHSLPHRISTANPDVTKTLPTLAGTSVINAQQESCPQKLSVRNVVADRDVDHHEPDHLYENFCRDEPLLEIAGRHAVLCRLNSTTRIHQNPVEDAAVSTKNSFLAQLGSKVAKSRHSPLFRIMSSVYPALDTIAKLEMVIGFFGAAVHAACAPAFAFFLAGLVRSYALKSDQQSSARQYAVSMVAVAVVDTFSTYLFRSQLEKVAQKWVDSLRMQALECIVAQPRAFFDEEQNHPVKLCGSLHHGAEEVRDLLGRFASMAFVAVTMMLVTLIWALVASWKMTLLCLTIVPYIYATTKTYSVVSGTWESRSNAFSDQLTVISAETFTKIRTVKTLTLEGRFWQRYVTTAEKALVVGFKRSCYTGLSYGLSESAGTFSVAIVLYIATRLVANGAATDGIITVLTMLMFSIAQIAMVLAFIPQIENAQDVAVRLLRLANLSKGSHKSTGSIELTNVENIDLKHVTFAYPSRMQTRDLENLDLSIVQSAMTVIAGGSGSGKSTIFNLLLKLYNVDTASRHSSNGITVNNHRIQDISAPSLRSVVVPVFQSPVLFPTTIAENITYGLAKDSPYNNHNSIIRAASMANIHDFIVSLPQGYQTVLGQGENGMKLSGGQAQRMTIARALIRRPRVLLLDEPTSALDAESAQEIRKALRDVVQIEGTTVIVNSHATEMMQCADRVVVLEDGKVAEQGLYDDLMRRRGALSRLLSQGRWDDGNDGCTNL